ncbi:hypothetical protein HWV62_24272 [Athelia sp. TMB]|nr:hypothetical protein HWV62_24272 [Athelia sp. TMB]
MVRGAKLKPDFQYYVTQYPSDDESTHAAPPANTHNRHVHLNTGDGGTRNLYIPSVASPSKRAHSPSPEPQWNTDPLPNFDSHPYLDPAYQHEMDLKDGSLPKRKRTKSDTPLLNWIPDVDIFLKEILRLEGRGDYAQDKTCFFCNEGAPEYRCENCFGGELYCKKYRTTSSRPTLARLLLLTFESKASGFALYNTLSRATDNTGTSPHPDRYAAFMRMVREWRHIKLLKRAGRGHVPEGPGPSSAAQGDCAVICPACPHPGRNIPDDWAEREDKWVYALFLAIDANFRLKRKDVSSDAADPSLNRGRAYFVEENRYKTHLAAYGDQEETKSDCVNHDAVKSANKYTAGLAATGAGTVDCARHNMKRPHAVGDLQAGESLLGCMMTIMNISYDICCQWGVHLRTRMTKYPEAYWIDFSRVDWVYLVPKFHLPAHIMRCQTAFSFNFTRWVGRTDGEAPERGWADINAVAASTQEMGPGSRRDTLDDHFGDWNHRKIVAMAPTFLRKIKAAVPERADQVDIFDELSADLQPQQVAAWTVAVEAWENDKKQVNPFVAVAEIVTEREVKLQLAREEGQELLNGEADILHHTLSPSVCLTAGMDLETQQRSLRIAASGLNENSTSVQRTKIQLRDNAMRRKITAWMKIQEIYMPAAAIIRAKDLTTATEGAAEVPAHDIALLLPSTLPLHTSIDIKFFRYELRLRRAQAQDAIFTLRRNLRLQAHLFNEKTRFSRGQGENTRSNDTVARVRGHVAESATCYRTARAAIARLSRELQEIGWQSSFPLLSETDVRQMAVGLDGESEGTRTLSWIWRSGGVGGDKDTADSVQEDYLLLSTTTLRTELRIEWCKARARAYRWSEEVFLLLEEMTRVQKYHTWHAGWWEEHAFAREGLTAEESEGFAAYAFYQSNICIAMGAVCTAAWTDVEKYVSLGVQLPELATGLDDDEEEEAAAAAEMAAAAAVETAAANAAAANEAAANEAAEEVPGLPTVV